MTYPEAIEELAAAGAELAGSRRKFELDHMRTLAHALGDPQTRFPSVLVAGTNGKGSTAATLASILACSGYRVGLYTSPHLLRVNERIQLSDSEATGNTLQPVADRPFAESFAAVNDAAKAAVAGGTLPQMPSFFETLTAMAFHAFASANVDVAVLEVGLGGRLDATNIVEPLCSVITDIALDHTEWLGETITEIAREKAGILRQDGVLITLPQHPEANAAIGDRAVALNVTGINAAAYLPQPSPREPITGNYRVPAFHIDMLVEPRLPGEHQRRNLALALATVEWLARHRGFDRISAETAMQGIREVRWPGRLERCELPTGATLLLDVAHNPAGVWTLRSFLSRSFDDGSLPAPRTLVFSGLQDKALEEMSQILFPLFEEPGDRIVLAPVHSPRAAGMERLTPLAAEPNAAVLPDVASAFQLLAGQQSGTVVVAGSVYLVAEWKAAMLTVAGTEVKENV